MAGGLKAQHDAGGTHRHGIGCRQQQERAGALHRHPTTGDGVSIHRRDAARNGGQFGDATTRSGRRGTR